uniref:norbelladine synthase-like n=1 Tax=Erigeron canadensis TaxID=72917 RepID=UPI001CB90710|nr:norbelladine synthase-like [Erigeron canadensis]
MFGTLSEETQVKVPATKAWALYGTLELGKVASGTILESVDLVEGDGAVGTILKLTLKPGLGLTYYKEKFTKIDHENKIKETEVVEGGFLDLGFNLYRFRIEIKEIPNDDTSCRVICTIEFEVKEEFAANASFVTAEPMIALMSVANEHLLQSN